MAVLRTLQARILIGFALLILTFGVTSTYVVVFVHNVGVEVSVIRERFLPLAFQSKDFLRSQQDLHAYITEDRTDEPYPRVQLRLKYRHKKRMEEFAKLGQVIETMARLPARHEKPMKETAGRVDHVGSAIAEIQPDYTWFFAQQWNDAAADTPYGLLRRMQFDAMMKRFLTGEHEVSRRAAAVADQQERLVESLTRRLERNEARLLKFTIFLGGIAIIVGLLITVWATMTLRPLRRLRLAARRIAAGDYTSRIEERGPTEVVELAREFNVIGRAVEERQSELVRSERLATVGKMAAMITHEVRNPLSSIALNTELLEDELDGRPEARELCRAITREVDRLTALTEDYLAFARLPPPKLIAEQANEVVGSVAQFVREDLMARGVALDVTLAPELPLARIDPGQLRQCLLNLLRNATEAVSGRPSPTVSLATRPGADATIEIVVSDNGPGLSTEVQARLFEPFVSTKTGGTGLGLALTHQIIREHGGELRVASRPEVGATFTVVLPHARGTKPEVANPAVGG
jgi:two-component system NtrC family sensor kinase